jgi:opacity protein-like surface antigen
MTRVFGSLLAMFLIGVAAPAAADITGFLGANTTPDSRPVKGVAVGSGILILGFEFEYASTDQDASKGAPSIKSGMGNVLLQTPIAILGFQPYFTTGGGAYRERLGSHEQTGFGLNTGGGVKISLAGPVRLRLDYRVFKLGSDALYSPSHRFYAGINLKF